MTSAQTFDRVVPCLYIGGGCIPIGDLTMFDVFVPCAEETFDHYSLASIPDAYSVCKCPLIDGPLSKSDYLVALGASRFAYDSVTQGAHVLVTCMGGLNRSGLVAGLVLRMMGYDPTATTLLVRAARGPFALSNKHFVKAIEEWKR